MTTPAPGSLEVARSGSAVFVRVQRLGIASVGLDLWDFAEEMARKGYTKFIIDLSHCQSFDSTFMGVLVGIAEGSTKGGGGGVMVVQPSAHHKKLLSEVGLTKLLTIRDGLAELPDGLELSPLEPLSRNSSERVELIRDAHVRLTKLDERNRVKFGPFLDLLAREIGPKKDS
ncbi:MAG: STAS domain-containing protein [Planctomycetota bacterium]|jgi:anti-anti-sigma factor